ncbi:MAG: PAS domain-containing protein, partial [Gammaproteobacteria bacterium]|nr:PAS domain-containing protein [Gammaproteobacteria bacterium]
WIDATPRQRNAGYPHLSPGSYELHLRARYPGQDYGPERVLDVHLAPLWWQSNWARTAFVLAVLLPFAWVGWNRRQRSAERARAQADLAESEERLKLALWGTGDEFWDADLRVRRLVRVNPLRHPGTRRERESLPFNEFRARIHPEDRATFVDRLRRHLRGNSEEFDCSYRLAIDVGPDWCWVRTRGRSVQHDSAGRPQRMAGITEDITELRAYEQTLQRINQELERRVEQRTADLQSVNKELVSTIEQLKLTQHQLVESEKLAALGSLVAGVAHEVNTPLGVGVTAASHLEQQAREFAHKLESGEVAAADFAAFRATLVDGSGIVLRNLQRADRMIRSFKQVAVDQASEAPRRIDVSAYLDEVLLSLQPTLKRHPQRVEKDVESGLVVLTHPGAIYQIIVNLVMNSLIHGFARRNDGRIRIVVRRVDDHWWLEYSDDGCGMTEEVRRHIFEPFFTTRRGQGGSGLGLHIVYNLVVQGMGGSIECETAPDRGTRFSIRIPMLVEASAGESAPAPRTATE